jgi:hypothetical protein
MKRHFTYRSTGEHWKEVFQVMKPLRLFATMLLGLELAACAAATAPERTKASSRIQSDVLDVIQVLETGTGQSCAERKLVETEVVKKATAEDYSAVERWTIDRCGKLVRYLVTFQPGANGGVDFSVRTEG